MTRVLRKYQFTDPNERVLFSTKLKREIMNLEQWFENMVPNSNERVKLLLK